MQTSPSTLALLLLLLVLTGCEQASVKTDSMIYRETAIKKAQVPIIKVESLLTDQVREQPTEYMDTLVVAKRTLQEAKSIYKSNNIGNIKDPKLDELNQYFDGITPKLTEHARSLLTQVVDRTTLLRKQIEDAKNQPYSARAQDTSQLVEFLAQNYNKDVKSCCLNQLSQIDQLLQHQATQHRELIILIRTINEELGEVIKDAAYARKLKQRILLTE